MIAGYFPGRAGAPTNPPAPALPPAITPRDFYNNGTRQLASGQWREAEASFETVLASQQDRLRTPALFNLGHVRYQHGAAELKKSLQSGPPQKRGREAVSQGQDALAAADQALASADVRQMVAAYLRGRGVRKELRSALKAVKRAMEAHAATLGRWERASGDFKSAAELDARDPDAIHNADVVDRNIAKLIDSLRELQQMAAMMGQQCQDLGDKLKQLKGRIPEPDAPPGAPGDEEEEEDQPLGPEPGKEEGPTRDGKEMPLTPEQASFLLDAYKLGTDRRLPMGQDSTAEPKNRVRPNW